LAEILAEILRNTQNFGRNSEEKIGHWSLCWRDRNLKFGPNYDLEEDDLEKEMNIISTVTKCHFL